MLVDLEKIKEVVDWQRPTNVMEERSFWSGRLLSTFCQRLFQNSHFDNKVAIEECEVSVDRQMQARFLKLKRRLVTASILTLLVNGKKSTLYNDASM